MSDLHGKWIAVAAACLALVALISAYAVEEWYVAKEQSDPSRTTVMEVDRFSEKSLVALVEEFNASLPRKTNRGTQLTRLTAGPGMHVTAHIEATSSFDLQTRMKEQGLDLGHLFRDELCASGTFDHLFRNDVTLAVKFLHQNGLSSSVLMITRADCRI